MTLRVDRQNRNRVGRAVSGRRDAGVGNIKLRTRGEREASSCGVQRRVANLDKRNGCCAKRNRACCVAHIRLARARVAGRDKERIASTQPGGALERVSVCVRGPRQHPSNRSATNGGNGVHAVFKLVGLVVNQNTIANRRSRAVRRKSHKGPSISQRGSNTYARTAGLVVRSGQVAGSIRYFVFDGGVVSNTRRRNRVNVLLVGNICVAGRCRADRARCDVCVADVCCANSQRANVQERNSRTGGVQIHRTLSRVRDKYVLGACGKHNFRTSIAGLQHRGSRQGGARGGIRANTHFPIAGGGVLRSVICSVTVTNDGERLVSQRGARQHKVRSAGCCGGLFDAIF